MTGLTKIERKAQFPTGSSRSQDTDQADTPENIPTKVNDYKKIVYCNFRGCKFNQEIDSLIRDVGGAMKNPKWKSLGPTKQVWRTVCTRDEVFLDVITYNGEQVPRCFTPSVPAKKGISFQNLLNPDGTALGGNIESQSYEYGSEAYKV